MIRFALLVMLLPGMTQAACRQALALGLDVSGSVDAVEYRLQLDGLATALNSPDVRDVLFVQPDAPIEILVYEWSGPLNQTIVVPWTPIVTTADLAQMTATLRSHPRAVAAPTTAIGSAMLAGFGFLEQRPTCWKRTLDLSGDGQTNTGPRPQDIGEGRTPIGVVVNGLVIGSGDMRSDDERFAINKMPWNNWSSVMGAVRVEIRPTARRMNHEPLYMQETATADASRRRQEHVGVGVLANAGLVAKEVVRCWNHRGVVRRGPRRSTLPWPVGAFGAWARTVVVDAWLMARSPAACTGARIPHALTFLLHSLREVAP